MNEIIKVCKVHGDLKLDLIYKDNRGYIGCKLCRRANEIRNSNQPKAKAYNLKWEKDNREKRNAYKNERYKKLQGNKDKYSQFLKNESLKRRQYREKNRTHVNDLHAIRYKRYIQELSYCYVKARLGQNMKLKHKYIPEPLIEFFRTILKLKRTLGLLKKNGINKDL